MSLKRPFVPKSDVKQRFTTTTTTYRVGVPPSRLRVRRQSLHEPPASNLNLPQSPAGSAVRDKILSVTPWNSFFDLL